MYFTKAGQQELVRKPFSTSSEASLNATMSAPRAASITLLKPSSLSPETTFPRGTANCPEMDGATTACTLYFVLFPEFFSISIVSRI